ncbi:MAG: DinB family protein [Cytophaga sp.]|uniref:DinB family protein n=1 Tax=Cytophaga sp. TaxID=29535 RepID=UPI003F7D76BB
MKKEIDRLKKTRSFLLSLLKDLNTVQLNEIPSGFNNNIIWNLGHLIASQQGLCYLRSGLTPVVDEKIIQLYKSQTRPEALVSAEEITRIKQVSLTVLDQLEEDYQKNKFSSYEAFTTRYDVTIESIDDAIEFLLFHEGLHLGYIMALKRSLTNK